MVYVIYDPKTQRYVGRDACGRFSTRRGVGSDTEAGAAHLGSRAYAEDVARPFGAEVHEAGASDGRAALL